VKGATISPFLHAVGGFAVSIHAPVKGATHSDANDSLCSAGFNPRTREGCDYPEVAAAILGFMFQSTHP